MSTTTRPGIRASRAGAGTSSRSSTGVPRRQRTARDDTDGADGTVGSTRTTQQRTTAPARSPRSAKPAAKPARPARRHPLRVAPARRTAATSSAAPPPPSPRRAPQPHRPTAKVARLPLSRSRGSWASGTFQRRVRLVRLALVVALLLLVARLVDVQVLHAGAYEAAARGESSISVSLPSVRGGIYARDGSPLAMSVPTDDVVADDFQVAHPAADGAGAVTAAARPRDDARDPAAPAVGLCRPGPAASAVDGPHDRR